MKNTVPKEVRDILERVSTSNAPYAPVADGMLVSLSADAFEIIALPSSVMMLMDRGVIPNRVARSQEDLLEIMGSMAKALSTSKETEAEELDVDLPTMISQFRLEFRELDAEALRGMHVEQYADQPREVQYAAALAYLDTMGDRGFAAHPSWMNQVSNYLTLNTGDI